MPAKSKRVYVTIDPDTEAALKALSEASGIAQSAWAASVLRQGTPALWQLAKALQTDGGSGGYLADVAERLAREGLLRSPQVALDLGGGRVRSRGPRKGRKRAESSGD